MDLGKYGLANTKNTMKEKAKKEASKPTPPHSEKENKARVCNLKYLEGYFHSKYPLKSHY